MWVGTGYAFTLDGADRFDWPSEDDLMSDVKDRRQFDWNRRPFSALELKALQTGRQMLFARPGAPVRSR